MDTLTDIELLIVARAIGNSSNNDLRAAVNKHRHENDAIINSELISARQLYEKLNDMLRERDIDYDTGVQTTTITTKLKLEGIL
jgi:hypothetical protein